MSLDIDIKANSAEATRKIKDFAERSGIEIKRFQVTSTKAGDVIRAKFHTTSIAAANDLRKFSIGANADMARVSSVADRTASNFSKNVSGIASSFRSVTRVFAAAGFTVGLQSIVRGIEGVITNASDLVESVNAVEVTFGDASNRILEFSKIASSTVGIANSDFSQLSTVTGALLRDTGLSLDQVAESTINIGKRAADMASVFNTDVKDALAAINAGLRGEEHPLRRYAIDVTENTLKAYALAEGIEKSVEKMTQQEKILLRLQLIMDRSARTAGDFKNTQDEFANSSRTLGAEWKDFTAELGAFVLPIAKDTVHGLLEITRAMRGYEGSIKAVQKASFTRLFGLQHILPLLNEEQHVLHAIGDALPAALIPAEVEQEIPKLLQATNEQLEKRARILEEERLAHEKLIAITIKRLQVTGALRDKLPKILAIEPELIMGPYREEILRPPDIPVPEVPTELPEDIRTIRDYFVEIGDHSDAWVQSILDAKGSLIDTENLTNAIAFNLGRAVHEGFDLKNAFIGIASLAATTFIPGFGGQLISGFLGGFQTGGGVNFRVPGSGGPDSQFYGFRASPGEDVSLRVTRPGQTASSNPVYNITINTGQGINDTFSLRTKIVPQIISEMRRQGAL